MSLTKERIYIAVKTYPTISEEYSELVCTAGVREDGSWIRLYPVPFRLLKDDQKYPKYSWIEADVERQFSDFRPESFRPELSSVKVIGNNPKSKNVDWDIRRKILFKNKEIYTNLESLINKAHDKSDPISLAIFKPSKLIDFVVEKTDREWDPKKLASLQAASMQFNLFKTAEELEKEFRVVRKVPYKFSYRFEDDVGKKSKLMIEDWEIGMLFFNCLDNAKGDEETAVSKVRGKYWDIFLEKDIYFFLGTTLKNHYVSKNPFVIVGVFYPPFPSEYQQLRLFD